MNPVEKFKINFVGNNVSLPVVVAIGILYNVNFLTG